jgi:hypothetical protein
MRVTSLRPSPECELAESGREGTEVITTSYMVVKVGVENSGTWGLGSSLEEDSHWVYRTMLSRQSLGKLWTVSLSKIKESIDRIRKGLRWLRIAMLFSGCARNRTTI